MTPVDAYVTELATRLPFGGRLRRRVLAETRDHLLAAAADEQARGFPPAAAERRAVTRFGPPLEVARAFSAIVAVASAVTVLRLVAGALALSALPGLVVSLADRFGAEPTSFGQRGAWDVPVEAHLYLLAADALLACAAIAAVAVLAGVLVGLAPGCRPLVSLVVLVAATALAAQAAVFAAASALGLAELSLRLPAELAFGVHVVAGTVVALAPCRPAPGRLRRLVPVAAVAAAALAASVAIVVAQLVLRPWVPTGALSGVRFFETWGLLGLGAGVAVAAGRLVGALRVLRSFAGSVAF